MVEHRQLQQLLETLREHAKNFEEPETYLDGVEDALTQVQRFEPARPPAAPRRSDGAQPSGTLTGPR